MSRGKMEVPNPSTKPEVTGLGTGNWIHHEQVC